MVEVNAAVQNRRSVEERALDDPKGLWATNIKKLQENGFSDKEILDGLSEVNVEAVLTAHPTEAKRVTVLEHHRELYLLLVNLENSMYTSFETRNIRNNIKLVLYRLWKTGEIYLEKPDVTSELRHNIHYLVNVFPEIIPIVDRRLLQAAHYCGMDEEQIPMNSSWPRMTFGDWVV